MQFLHTEKIVGPSPTASTKTICARSIMDNTLGYELSNGGSIPSGRTKCVATNLRESSLA